MVQHNLNSGGGMRLSKDRSKAGVWWWIERAGLGLAAVIIVGLAVLSVNATVRDRRIQSVEQPAGSELVDIGGRQIHLYRLGADNPGPTVVLVGCFGCNSANWQSVQPGIAAYAPTIAFDPAGYGWSDPGPPITPRTMADDLYRALDVIDVDRVILVGFSAGMLPIYDFADRYGDQIEVAGMVSVEGAILDDLEAEWYPPYSPLGLSESMTGFLIATGVARLMAGQMQGPMPETVTNVDYYQLAAETARTRRSLRTWASQYTSFTHDDVVRVLDEATLPTDLPVVVLRSADIASGEGAAPAFAELAAEYGRASIAFYDDWVAAAAPGSEVIVVEETSHFIMNDQPQAVIEAVRQVVEMVGL
jgi:pimeloyl-ACP methyl ester carboxylesterase